ncbi:hypothetical protein SMICM17S_04346 [Streptomyces microflavus]
MRGPVPQHPLESPPYAARPPGRVHRRREPFELLAPQRQFAQLVGLARVRVVAAGEELPGPVLAESGREEAGPAADPGRRVGGDDLLVRPDGGDPVAVHGHRTLGHGRRADRQDQGRGVNRQHRRTSWR